MIAVSTSPACLFMLRKANVWCTICDGNWSNPNIWLSNALDKKLITVPQAGDTVYINHSVTLDSNNLLITSLYGNGKLIFGTSALNFNVLLCINMPGTIDMSNAYHQLNLFGQNNYLANFICGSSSTVNYVSNGTFQFVMPLTYRNLNIASNGINQLAGDVTVNGNLILGGNPSNEFSAQLELSIYNFIVNGTTTLGQPSLISKNSNIGSTLFVGAVTASGGDRKRFDLSVGNPDFEFRGGLSLNQNSAQSNLGSGTMHFTTNNQNLNGTNTYQFGANISIGSGVTLTITGSGIYSYGIINGTDATSVLNNNSQLYLANNTLPMATGVFNYMNASTSILGVSFDGNSTLPYTTFAGLVIEGTGTKTLSGNTIVNQNLTVDNSGNLECSSYSLTINGTTTCGQPSLLSKNSPVGLVLFVGALTLQGGDAKRVNFTGNPNIEFRGGLTVNQDGAANIWGSGNMNFTTNSQTLNVSANLVPISCPITIDGAITLTVKGGTTSSWGFIFQNTINGTKASSTLAVECYIEYQDSQQPMEIGTLNCGTTLNSFVYNLNGNQDITPGTYKNLTLSSGGVKKLLGDVNVQNIYTLSSPATLNANGFNLTNP